MKLRAINNQKKKLYKIEGEKFLSGFVPQNSMQFLILNFVGFSSIKLKAKSFFERIPL